MTVPPRSCSAACHQSSRTALGGGGVVLEVQSSARRGVGEVRLGVAYGSRASASRSAGSRWRRFSTVRSRRDGRRERGRGRLHRPQGAGAGPDEDRFSVGVVDQAEERCEDAGLGPARFVDDQDGAVGQTALALGVEEESVHRCAADARRGLELFGGATARSRPQHRHARVAVGVGQDAERGRLAGTGGTDDADDPVRFTCRCGRASAVSAQRGPGFSILASGRELSSAMGAPASLPASAELERLPLDLDQFARRESRRPTWCLRGLDQLDARERRQPVSRRQ